MFFGALYSIQIRELTSNFDLVMFVASGYLQMTILHQLHQKVINLLTWSLVHSHTPFLFHFVVLFLSYHIMLPALTINTPDDEILNFPIRIPWKMLIEML